MPAPAAKRQRLDDGTCWAHTRGGARCAVAVGAGAVPYCTTHLNAGDGALRRVKHPDPLLGFALVARVPLPEGYRFCFWGDRVRRSPTDKDDRTLQFLSGRDRMNPNGAIDPSAHDGSLGQWLNSPASSELPTARATHQFFGEHNSSELVGQEFVVTRALQPNQQLAFSYSSEWWRLRAGIKRLPAGCARFPLPERPKKRPSSRDPRQRLDEARQQQLERLEALLPLITGFLPGLGDGDDDGDEAAANDGGDGGVLLEIGVGVDGGLVRALAAVCTSGQLVHDVARPVRLLGAARSAEVGRRLGQQDEQEEPEEDEEGGELEVEVSSFTAQPCLLPSANHRVVLLRQWGGSLRALAAATAGGVSAMIGKIQTSVDEEGIASRAEVQAKRAGLSAREQRLTAEEAVSKAQSNAAQAALSQVAQAGKLLRPGGALLLESDSDDEDMFMQWLQLVCPAFGREQPAAGQLLRSDDGGPCVWLLRKRDASGVEAAEDAAKRADDGDEEDEIEIEILEY